MEEFNISFDQCESEFHNFDDVNQELNDISFDGEIDIYGGF